MGIFGLIAFCLVLSLQSKVSKLERQMREGNFGEDAVHAGDLSDSLQSRIGKKVKFDFYEDEMNIDLVSGTAEIVDVDEKWVLVHWENKKKQADKLIRISSIKGIKEV